MIPVFLLLCPGFAHAASLGNIEVTSHLGEPFYAEVPIHLEEKESINSVFVELASPADYRILEIYRDPGLNAIRVDVVNDSRGQRVELSSDSAIRTPYFSLVLKLRYGRATHFKKYPIVLDLPKSQTKVGQPIPETLPWKAAGQEKEAGSARKPDGVMESGASEFKPFDGWARTGRYGPMVTGDTISVVARRLRIDERYTLPQVMVALFEKNKDKFDQGNINLIEKGVFLDVPTAREVEAISPTEARRVLDEHEKRWRDLRKKPKYEAIAEAQKHRYSRRIRIGGKTEELATGSAPVVEDIRPPEVQHETSGSSTEQTAIPVIPEPEVIAEIALLQQRNAELEERLAKTEEKLQTIAARINATQTSPESDRLGDLEKQLSRLQTELSRALSQAQGALAPVGSSRGKSGMTTLLAGSIVLLLIAILFLLRRQKAYIASLNKLAEGESSEREERRPDPAHVGDDLPERTLPPGGGDEGVTAASSSVGKTVEGTTIPKAGEKNIDPNMDYLGEAEVYLRYGMEDEAIENIRLAILQHPDNVDAHCKLIRLLAVKGDSEALDLAIAAGRKVLAGNARERFEDEVVQVLGGRESPMEKPASGPKESVEGKKETSVSGTDVAEGETEEISFISETREDESVSDLGEIEWTSLEQMSDVEEERGVIDSYDELIRKEGGSEQAPVRDQEGFDFELESAGETEASQVSNLPQTEPETAGEPVTGQSKDKSGQSPLDLGAEALLIDTGRSLLASGSLDEAERLFHQALEGSRRGLALLGLAEIAKKRGDEESARSLLTQAEPLLDETSRDWFNRLTS